MEKSPQSTRRQFLGMGVPALATAAIVSSQSASGADSDAGDLPEGKGKKKPWSEERKIIERKWLDLLGEFPEEIPDLRVKMKEVAR